MTTKRYLFYLLSGLLSTLVTAVIAVMSAPAAFADNCATPADCFGTAAAFNTTATGLVAGALIAIAAAPAAAGSSGTSQTGQAKGDAKQQPDGDAAKQAQGDPERSGFQQSIGTAPSVGGQTPSGAPALQITPPTKRLAPRGITPDIPQGNQTPEIGRTLGDGSEAAPAIETYEAGGSGRKVEIVGSDLVARDARSSGPRTAFGNKGGLTPNTDYVVLDKHGSYRGVFVTDATGTITDVYTISGKQDLFEGQYRHPHVDPRSGKLNPKAGDPKYFSPEWNANLNKPLPSVRHHVDGRYVFTTDALSRTVDVSGCLEYSGGDVARRLKSAQSSIGRAGRDAYKEKPQYEDAKINTGHVAANEFFGPGERINLIAMLEKLNQHQIGSTYLDNWRNLERLLGDLVRNNHDVCIRFKINYLLADSTMPDSISVEYWKDGVKQTAPPPYQNVPPRRTS